MHGFVGDEPVVAIDFAGLKNYAKEGGPRCTTVIKSGWAPEINSHRCRCIF